MRVAVHEEALPRSLTHGARSFASTYWGSWAFMIASVALYYEVENKKEQSLRDVVRAVMRKLNGTRGTKDREAQGSLPEIP